MQYPLHEALRRNGKTYRPPGEVALDPKEDATEIARLTRKGVIGQPGAGADADAAAKADEEAKAKPAARKPASKTAQAKE